MSDNQLRKAEVILATLEHQSGVTWDTLAKKYGVTYYMVRKQCDPTFINVRLASRGSVSKRTDNGEYAPIPPPPLLCGDPLLDRLKAGYR